MDRVVLMRTQAKHAHCSELLDERYHAACQRTLLPTRTLLIYLCSLFRDVSDPDLDSDLVIFRIVKSQHAALFAAGLSSLNADYCAQTRDLGRADGLYVFGYPDEGRGYDHDNKVLNAQMHGAE